MARKTSRLLPVAFGFAFLLLATGCRNETTAQEYYQKSFQFIHAGNTQDAIDLLTLAIEKDPSFFEAYHNRGAMYYYQKNYSEALKDFDKAISLSRRNAAAPFASRGAVYEKLNEPDRALADFKTAARLGDQEAQQRLRSKGVTW